MKDNELKITVSGKVGIGKTTLLAYLFKILLEENKDFIVWKQQGEKQTKYMTEAFLNLTKNCFETSEQVLEYELCFLDYLKAHGITKVILNEKVISDMEHP